MSVWDTYQRRMDSRGKNRRDAVFNREFHMLNNKFDSTLSYHTVQIGDRTQDVTIINSDNLNEKKIITRPGEDFVCGELVEWANNYWLISEKDANNELYTKGKLLQCNHLLKWIDSDGVIREQWCVIEDGTKLKCICTIVWRIGNNAQQAPFELLETPKAIQTTTRRLKRRERECYESRKN